MREGTPAGGGGIDRASLPVPQHSGGGGDHQTTDTCASLQPWGRCALRDLLFVLSCVLKPFVRLFYSLDSTYE